MICFIKENVNFYICTLKAKIMSLVIEEKDLEKFIMVGDRILVKPKNENSKDQYKANDGIYVEFLFFHLI